MICIIGAGLILLGCAPSLGSLLLQPGAGGSLAGVSQMSLAAQGSGGTLQAPADPGEVEPASIDCYTSTPKPTRTPTKTVTPTATMTATPTDALSPVLPRVYYLPIIYKFY